MARNEEKQLGNLNRLWLQREKEEGRLREIHQNRPKLSSLTSAVEVKKWIPSIKTEIEYYLQQSQLSHYSERKIKEFQDHIEELQKEYQHYLWKLRQLDPSHKDHPWKPRAYTRKRPPNSTTQTISQLATLHSLKRLCMPPSNKTEDETHEHDSDGKSAEVRERSCLSLQIPDGVIYDCSMVNSKFQDQPLTFNPARVPSRFSMHFTPKNTSGEGSHHMTKILLSQLPNLQTSSSCGTKTELNREEEEICAFKVNEDSQESILQNKSCGMLGLSCYSSDEDT
ncbi:pre-mRNA-splicing factor ISY1 homolog [Carcharodon carcharias]|uniref:pre-mRNA-splicing factor ISY1 homolog n=1 Tax=Carcharodon carcharias TaxID=13397 RepID=UPI001B7EFDA1|nr:pre-mRNA-splicing factor ISY1 homolog [Carcharodon carcharias]